MFFFPLYLVAVNLIIKEYKLYRDFPGGPVVRTPHFHYRGHKFDPWSGN